MKKRRTRRSVGKNAPGSRALIRREKSVYVKVPHVVSLTPAQEAQHITFVIQGMLKRSRLQFLIIAAKLVEFKEKKRYADLHYADLESYAEDRLGLGRASLYRYLQIYAWVLREHSDWLKPKCKGFIPDFNDCIDIFWLEHELKRKDLTPALESKLDALLEKALHGKLKKGDLDPYRKKKRDEKGALKAFLSSLRLLRKRGAELKAMLPEVITTLDSAIEMLEKVVKVQLQQKRMHRHP